jgi:hypothetical protein
MSEKRAKGGFGCWVSDEQLQAYARLTPYQRLEWLDEARQFVLMALTDEARKRQERLRRGLTITEDPEPELPPRR